jgi:hypothetical protein
MKKITENALLYRVNQLREKMAIYEAPLDPNYQAKPFVPPQDQQTPLGNDINKAITTPPPKTPPVTPTTPPETPPETPTDYLGNALDSLKTGVKYAWDNPAEIAGGMARTLSGDIDGAKKIANAAIDGWKHPNGTTQNGGTQGQQKVGGKQGQQKVGGTHGQQHAGGAAPHRAPDPKVLELQNKLIAQGYPIKADGIMGPKTQAAYEWQAKNDDMAAKMSAYDKPAQPVRSPAYNDAYAAAIKNMDPNQTPTSSAPASTAAPAGGIPSTNQQISNAITPSSFASQQPAAQASAMPPPEKPEGVQVFKESPDHVSFGQEESLARILQLVKW